MDDDGFRLWLEHLRIHLVGELRRLTTCCELALYLRLTLLDVIDCRYVSFVRVTSSGRLKEIGASPGARDSRPQPRPSVVEVEATVGGGGRGGSWSEGLLHVRPIFDNQTTYLCLGTGTGVAPKRIESIMDSLQPILSECDGTSWSPFVRSSDVAPVVSDSAFTERQSAIMALIAQGMSNPSIAQCIGFSHSLVRQETTKIFRKLRVSNRRDAVLVARKKGLLD